MTIDVSDLGIKRMSSDGTVHSKVNYISMNERLNQNAIEKIKRVSSATDTSKQRNIAEISRQGFVMDSTPAYSIEFSSAGKVALQSFRQMKEQQTKAKTETRSRADDAWSFGAMDSKKASDRKKLKDTEAKAYVRQSQSMKNALEAYEVQMNFKPAEKKKLQNYEKGSKINQK